MQKIITSSCADFGKANIVIKHFPDTESYVRIPQIKSLKNKPVRIYHRLFPEPDKRIFELVLILSRLKQETAHIELFSPYLPYARQDRASLEGEAVSADVLCGILKSFGVKKLITYDCHFLPKPGDFTRNGLRIENRSAGKQLINFAKKYFGKEKFSVISPDKGSSYFIENAKTHLAGGHGFSLSKKRGRNEKHGLETEIHSMESEGDVSGKNICILDDMIATGGTLIRAMEHLKEKGAKKIICGSTHGIFAGENVIQKINNSSCKELFVTNSIKNDYGHNFVKILKLPLS